MRRQVLDIEGVATPVVSDGPADAAEAVVCLHGNPGFCADWFDLMPRVAPFARIVAPDMPGFGGAAKPPDFDYSPLGYTRYLTALLTRIGVARAHLVCHDFGVAWGLGWAVQHLDSLASLTLVNIGVMPGYRWHFWARVWRTPILGEASMAIITRSGFHFGLNQGMTRKLPAAFIDAMYDHYDARTRRAVLKLYRATDDMAALTSTAGEVFSAYRGPVCVVWGARDPFVDKSYAARQRETFAQADVHVLQDSGHWPHADDPERFAGVLVPFLRGATQKI